MPRIIISPQARADMDGILAYIAKDNPSAGARTIARFKEKFALLADTPRLSPERTALLPGIRVFPMGNYLILYREAPGGIEIARVSHGARDLDELFS